MISTDTYRSFSGSEQLEMFLQNVFRQVDTDKFMKIYQESVAQQNTPESIYQALYQRANEAKGNFITKVLWGLDALTGERNTLAENIGKVTDPNRSKNGYVEIGMPGRMIRSIGPMMDLKGNITVVNEQESIVQSGFPKPYHSFEQLTYDPLSLEEESADVISCFAGLHHCPEGKLDSFVDSIYNALSQGGVFFVREHDANSQQMENLAKIIHSVFNAASDVPLEKEIDEVRNFKSIEEWIKYLESRGFKYVMKEPLMREGDSSQNGLLKFVKVGKENSSHLSERDSISTVRERLISEKNNYTRKAFQTHMTGVEWFNVESSKNLGAVKNFWDYRYFRDVGQLWKSLYNSLKEATKVESLSSVIFSDYMLMNAVITTLMSVEYIAKGVLYTPVWAVAKISNIIPKSQVQDQDWNEVSDKYRQFLEGYGDRLDITPYYAQNYLEYAQDYWKNLFTRWNRSERTFLDLTFDRTTVKNISTGIVMTTDLLFRSITASTINAFFGGEENGDDREIGVIIDTSKEKTEKTTAVKEIKVDGARHKGLIAPRYKQLESFIKNLENDEITEIAGQTEMRLELVVDESEHSYDEKKLFERAYLPDKDKKIISLLIPVSQLPEYVKKDEFYRLYDF